jgi:hypothetical protein
MEEMCIKTNTSTCVSFLFRTKILTWYFRMHRSETMDSSMLANYLISIESLIKVAKQLLRFLKRFHPSYKEALCILTPLRSSVTEMLQKCHIDSSVLASKVPSDILLNFITFLIPFPVDTCESSTLRYCLLFLKELVPIHSLRLTSVYVRF